MSGEKWTPGPWVPARSVKKIKIAETYTTDDVCTESGISVCTMTGDCARAFHDVNLIAAAPELYAALKSALLLVDMSTSYRRQDIAEMGKNALKKARGES